MDVQKTMEFIRQQNALFQIRAMETDARLRVLGHKASELHSRAQMLAILAPRLATRGQDPR